MRLLAEHKALVTAQTRDAARRPRERFEAVCAECRRLLVAFVAGAAGGALAWPAFVVLQDQIRMEQVDAREKILRDELLSGVELPPLSQSARDPAALAQLLRGAEAPVPEWLVAMSDGGAGPSGSQ